MAHASKTLQGLPPFLGSDCGKAYLRLPPRPLVAGSQTLQWLVPNSAVPRLFAATPSSFYLLRSRYPLAVIPPLHPRLLLPPPLVLSRPHTCPLQSFFNIGFPSMSSLCENGGKIHDVTRNVMHKSEAKVSNVQSCYVYLQHPNFPARVQCA